MKPHPAPVVSGGELLTLLIHIIHSALSERPTASAAPTCGWTSDRRISRSIADQRGRCLTCHQVVVL